MPALAIRRNVTRPITAVAVYFCFCKRKHPLKLSENEDGKSSLSRILYKTPHTNAPKHAQSISICKTLDSELHPSHSWPATLIKRSDPSRVHQETTSSHTWDHIQRRSSSVLQSSAQTRSNSGLNWSWTLRSRRTERENRCRYDRHADGHYSGSGCSWTSRSWFIYNFLIYLNQTQTHIRSLHNNCTISPFTND